jgi:hypothetical protein
MGDSMSQNTAGLDGPLQEQLMTSCDVSLMTYWSTSLSHDGLPAQPIRSSTVAGSDV